MDKFFSILGQVVVAAGGAGAVIFAVSGYLAKLWSDYFMKKQSEKYEKEIENYKNNLKEELVKIEHFSERSTYKDKVLFDREFKIYQKFIPCIIRSDEIYSRTYEKLLHCINSGDFFSYEMCKGLTNIEFELRDLWRKYSVFIDEDISAEIDMYLYYVSKINEHLENAYLCSDIKQFDIGGIETCNNEIHVLKTQIIESVRKYFRDITKI